MRLNHLLAVEAKEVAESDYDDNRERWVHLRAIWGNLKPLSGQELIEAQQIVKNVTHQITTRWQNSVRDDMRLVHRGHDGVRVFYPRSVINIDERDQYAQILAIESDIDSHAET